VWGTWHGVFLAAQQTVLRKLFASSSFIGRSVGWLVTMVVVFAGWLVFRASTLELAMAHARALVTFSGGIRPALVRENGVLVVALIATGTLMTTLFHQPVERALARSLTARWVAPWLRPTLYAGMLLAIIVLDQEAKAFVYFQF
jgi:hypothetical protein